MFTTETTAPLAAPGHVAFGTVAKPPLALRAAQLLLLGPLGAVAVLGSVYFMAIAPPEVMTGFDWLTGAWGLALGAGNVFAGARLGGRRPALRKAALALVIGHLIFSAVKVMAFAETEAATFIAFDLLALALLASRSARRFFDGAV